MTNEILELKYGVVYYIKDSIDETYGPVQVKLVGPPPELFNTIYSFIEYHGEERYLRGKYKYSCSKDALELRIGDKYKINDKIYELESPSQSYNKYDFKYKFKLISSDSLKSTSSDENDQSKLIQQLKEELNNFKAQLSIKTKELQELQQKLEMSQASSSTAIQPQLQSNKFHILDSNDLSKFEKIDEIGFGDGGKVFKVAQKTFYALKEMNIKNITTKNFKNFIREYELMNMLDHPNIVKAYGFYMSDDTTPPSILLEYIPCNLNDAILNKTLKKPQIVCIIYQIAEGLKYIHFRNIIHCDIKPSNILINSKGFVKISDFGISKLMSNDGFSISNGLGTQKFMAPEILNEENYNEKVDVYSFGVLLYFIISGGELPKIKIKDICIGKKAQIPNSFTSYAKKLINECWNFDFNERPSFNSICAKLEKSIKQLLNLTSDEIQEVNQFLIMYKSYLPNYSK